MAAAPSGEVLFSSGRARGVIGRRLSELAAEFQMFHLDGRTYAASEWQLARTIETGEEIVDEEFLRIEAGRRVTYRCSCSPLYDGDNRIVAAVAITRDVTEAKRHDERLAYLAGLLDNTDDAIVAMDGGWHLTMWNHGAERMYGWTAGEVMGRHTTEVAHLDIGDAGRAGIRREVEERGRWRGVVVAHRRDGTAVPVELVTVALRDADGAISGFLGIHRDASERREAEAATRRNEMILESVTDAFCLLDHDWRFAYVNERAVQAMAELLGERMTREDFLARSVWDVFPVLLGTDTERNFRAAVREQETVVYEARYAGVERWFDIHAYPFEEGLSVYFRDITERKLAEQERERWARRQALVAELGQRALAGADLTSVMNEAVAVVARALDIELVAIAELLPDGGTMTLRAGVGWHAPLGSTSGAGRDSLVGYTVMAGAPVISGDVNADPRFEPSELLRTHQPVSAVSVVIAGLLGPFGALGAFSRHARSFSADDVNFLQGVANVISSAVERGAAEARLVEVRESERRRIARDLHDEALQDLTDALAQAALPGPPADAADAAQRLAGIVPALKRAGRHVRGAIYDLRLEAEQHRPFIELLGDLVELQQSLAADCRIELDVDDRVPVGPLGRLGTEALRIAGEALVNARRHASARIVRVAVSCSGGDLVIEISDDGCGLDLAQAPSGAGGTGLAGMRERAALLGGEVDVRGAPGAGTLVRCRLPLGDAAEQIRVLLVEDHTVVREAIAGMFEREAGFTVVGQAASLAEARVKLADVQVDVAVVDVGLPDGCGSDLIAELRDANPGAQALVLTGSLDPGDMARAVRSGAAGTLDKSAHLDAVVDAVRRLRAGWPLVR